MSKRMILIFICIFLFFSDSAESSQQVKYTLKRGISLSIPIDWFAKEEHGPIYKINGTTYDRYYFFAFKSNKNGDYAEISVLSKVPPTPTKQQILKYTPSDFKSLDSECLEAYKLMGVTIHGYEPYIPFVFKGFKAFRNSVTYTAPNFQTFVIDNIHLSTNNKSILISFKVSPPSSLNVWLKDLGAILESIKINE